MSERDVWFYEIRTSKGERFAPAVDWSDLVAKGVEPLSDEDNRYQSRGETYYGRIVRGPARSRDLLRIGRVRMRDHPMLYEGGRESNLDLADTAGLVERTHVAFFPRNVVGVLQGAQGATPGVVRAYINNVVKPKPKIRFQQLFEADVLDRLQHAARDGFRIGTFKPKPDADLGPLEDSSRSLRRIFEVQREEFPETEMTVTLRVVTDEDGRPPAVAEKVLDEMSAAASQHLHVFDSASMRFVPADEERTERINFINEKLGMRMPVRFEGARSRVVTDSSARTALQRSYERLEERIVAALGRDPTT